MYFQVQANKSNQSGEEHASISLRFCGVKHTMNMSNEEYVNKKARIGEVALGMLDGSVHYLKGSIELESLRHEIGAYANDPDFIVFVAILSEIDSLPFESPRQEWSAEELARYEPEIKQSIDWAKEISLVQCESLAERFRA